jgi:hypothetical protein
MASRRLGTVACLAFTALAACGGGGEPRPVEGFATLRGQTVLLLPVQYVARVPGGWAGGAANSSEAARQADREIVFALEEQGGRVEWVTADDQVEAVARRPWIRVDPLALSADEIRRKGGELRDVKDPLYGEIRVLGALFDARYAVWPLEIIYEAEAAGSGRLVLRTFLLDLRRGDVLWYGTVTGEAGQPPASPGAVASLAQRFAVLVSP